MITAGYYPLPGDLAADIDAYESEVARFLAGDLNPGVFKGRRVPRGVYEQRRDGTYMLRVRVAGGALHPDQASLIADVSREYGHALLHVTTRQDIQFHDLDIADTPAIMRRLMAVGLTSKGGGGNTVRNIAACPYAGICPAERFDVTPSVNALTGYLITLVGSYNLPRKYKIAFSGCAADCALAQVSDLGFIAELRDGRPGFRVVAGGGMGAHSRVADTLLEWSPAGDAIRVAETVRQLFDQHGDRKNRSRARLRYVFERMGADAFRAEYGPRFEQMAAAGVPAAPADLPVVGQPAPSAGPVPVVSAAGLRVFPQRQPGLFAVPLHLPLGFLTADDLAAVGQLAARFSAEGGLRATRDQNLLLRSVAEADLPALAAELRALGTDMLTFSPLERFVACAGASTCRLGICLARGAADACSRALVDAGIADDVLEAMRFHINGCPNACGQHPVAPIGCFGAAQRGHGRLVPSYAVSVGGRCGASGVRFGHGIGKLPAAALPAFVADLAADFAAGRSVGESFTGYVDRLGTAHFDLIRRRHDSIPPPAERPDFYRDIGAEEEFSLAGRGAGECGAGVFEVIQQDLAAAREADTPAAMLLAAARALLITRGVDGRDPDLLLREFERLFIDTGLVDASFRHLIGRGRGFFQGWATALEGQEEPIMQLRDRVEQLYATLDANLQFHPPGPEQPATGAPAAPAAALPAYDLSGVGCPLNFVKARLRLEMLAVGEGLTLILDDGDPIRNVPASLKDEGQEIVSIDRIEGGRWRVVVRKRR